MTADPIDERDDPQGVASEALLNVLIHHRQASQRRRERKQWIADRRRTVALLLGVVVALALVALNVLIWGNFTHIHLASSAPAATNERSAAPRPTATQLHAPRTAPSSRPGGGDVTKAALPRPISVHLTAARGDSWVQIRAGSPTGRVLFEGVMRRGESTHVTGRRLWARFGALGNLDVSVNGRPIHPTLSGTLDTVISDSAIRAAPAQSTAG